MAQAGRGAQACNPSTLGGQGGWITRSEDQDHPGLHGETPSLLKTQKISQVLWHAPVVQFLGRLGQEDCLNLGAGGGGCSEPRSCHCTSACVTELDSVSKRKLSVLMKCQQV